MKSLRRFSVRFLFSMFLMLSLTIAALSVDECEINGIQANGDTVTVEVSTNQSALLFVAAYADNGKMLQVVNANVAAGSEKSQIPVQWSSGIAENMETISAFLLDASHFSPLCNKADAILSDDITTGDFIVTGGTYGKDYSYANGVLSVLSVTPITISNADPKSVTADSIFIADGVSANISLAGVNIDATYGLDVQARYRRGKPALQIADNSKGDVSITLLSETENILQGAWECAGLQKNGDVDSGTLTIKGTGSLNAKGGYCGAGIGGGYGKSTAHITVLSGTITSSGDNAAGIGGGCRGDGSYLTISGGYVTATGYVGIGGGMNGRADYITISNGIVIATGGGSGIGGSGGSNGSGSNIIISDGDVTATGQAGINGTNITISGGKVNATGTHYQGIGPSDITISGGEVIATGGIVGGAGIGGGNPSRNGTDITITGGNVIATGGGDIEGYEISAGAGIGGSSSGNGERITIQGGNVTATGGIAGSSDSLYTYGAAGIGGGEYGHGSYITIEDGEVFAYAGGAAKNQQNESESSATLFGGFANHCCLGAAIGGGFNGNGSHIIISGGTVHAFGVVDIPNGFAYDQTGAAIGGGGWSGTRVVRNGVTETYGNGTQIEITGGTVYALGGSQSAGIGGGSRGSGSDINISGGNVNVSGGQFGAGIGGGEMGIGSDITISDGVIIATGGRFGAGIGGGDSSDGSNITISGGTVTVIAGEEADAVGAGRGGKRENITVSIELQQP